MAISKEDLLEYRQEIKDAQTRLAEEKEQVHLGAKQKADELYRSLTEEFDISAGKEQEKLGIELSLVDKIIDRFEPKKEETLQ